MKATRLLLVAALSTAALAAQADPFDAPEFNLPVAGTASRAAVQADLVKGRQAANPWSTSYNPLAAFKSDRTRAQVRAEYIANRDRVAAFTGEDSGAAYLAQHQATDAPRRFAGQPVNGL